MVERDLAKVETRVRFPSPARSLLAWTVLSLPLLSSTPPLLAYDDIRWVRSVELPDRRFEPGGVAALPGGGFAAVDMRAREICGFDGEGRLEKCWGAGAGVIKAPSGLAVSLQGKLYVSDAGSSRIHVFSPAREFLFSFGEKGAAPGQLSSPEGLFVAHDGVVFVADTGNARIAVFSPDGVFLRQFGYKGKLAGQLTSPVDVAVTPRGEIWVADSGTKRLEIFRPGGEWIASAPISDSLAAPSGLASDAFGYVYAADEKKNKVWEIGDDKTLKGTFGSKGEGRGQLKRLTGCAINREGRLFLADAGNRRVHVFELVNKAKVREVPASPTTPVYVEALESFALNATALAVLPSGDFLVLDAEKGALSRYHPDGVPVWSTEGRSDHPLGDARGLLVGSDGKIYVAHTKNREVDVWTAEGRWEQSFGSAKGEGRLTQPLQIASNPDGKLFIADGKAGQVLVYGRDGLFLYAVERTPKLETPTAVALGAEGPLFVLEQAARQVSTFEPVGKSLGRWGTRGKETGQLENPVSLAITPGGEIAVLDADPARIQAFTEEGRLRWAFGAPGMGAGQLKKPKFITYDDRDRLWVAEEGRLQVFAVRPVPKPVRDLDARSSDGSNDLSWTSEAGMKGFRVYRATSSVEPGFVFTESQAPQWSDADLFPNLTYYYWVSAVSAEGLESPRMAARPVLSRARANQPPLEIIDIDLAPLFAAYYKFYASNPVGSVKLRNNVASGFSKVKLGFTLKEFMDFPAEIMIEDWPGHQDVTRPLMAVFNNRILEVSETTPVQAEVRLTYFEDGQERTIVLTEPVTMHERNALAWDDPRHLGAFVTPKDPPVIEYGRKALQPYASQLPRGPFPQSVMIARVLYESLGVTGLTYTPDPGNPNLSHKDDATTVDYIQFPRQTLARKSGDCDDLLPLFAALAEGAGLETAMADMPGHVMPLVNTGEADASALGLPEERFLRLNGTLWIPVEATRVGSPFRDAWREGLAALRRWEKERKVKYVRFHEAWDEFAPVTLPEATLQVEPPEATKLFSRFGTAWNELLQERLNHIVETNKAILDKSPKDTVAMMAIAQGYADHRKYDEVEKWLNQVIRNEPESSAAYNNLGNLSFMSGNYPKAKTNYDKASKLDPDDDGIELNLCRLALAQSQKEVARSHYQRAIGINPSLADIYPDLNSVSIKEKSQ